MKDEFCKVCKFKTYSECKGRSVMCKCEWDALKEED
jgi:hypothetical protein